MSPMHVAVVGATGAVGREILRTLEERAFPMSELSLLASPRSEGSRGPLSGARPERRASGDRFVVLILSRYTETR